MRSLHSVQSPRRPQKPPNVHFVTTCRPFCSPYSPPEGQTKQPSVFPVSLQRKTPNFSVDFKQVQKHINQKKKKKNSAPLKTFKKQAYALNPGELMLLSLLTTSEQSGVETTNQTTSTPGNGGHLQLQVQPISTAAYLNPLLLLQTYSFSSLAVETRGSVISV